MEFPKELHYTKDHEWARKNDSSITIGITAFAVDQLGDITLVDLPEVGEDVASGETCGTIESVKAVSDLYAPITGQVVSINEDLEDSPELVNEDCYGKGWMIEIEPSGAGLESLMDSKAYAELVAKES